MENVTNTSPMMTNFTFELSSNWLERDLVKSHFHLCYEIYYLLSGEVEYFIGDHVFRVRPGNVVIIPPGTIHKANKYGHADRKRMLVYIHENDFHEQLAERPDLLSGLQNNVIELSKNKKAQIESLFIQLAEEYDSKEPDRFTVHAVLVLLLAILGKLNKANIGNDCSVLNDVVTSPMLDIVRYLNQHYFQDISLEILAQKFHMNPTHISRAFKKKIGFSYSTYLKNIRIRNACDLLRQTDFNATQIAEKTGFNSCSDFCRTFKEVMHISPLKYRKQN